MTNNDALTVKQFYQGFLQDCPSGKMTQEDLINLYEVLFPKTKSKVFCDNLFRAYDEDGDGYIDFKEFMLALNCTTHGTVAEKIKWVKLHTIRDRP